MTLRHTILVIFTFLSCSSVINKKFDTISNPFITDYLVDENGYLYISIHNPTKDEYSIGSLEYLCNVGIKSKKEDKYLNTIKVKLNCDRNIIKPITLKPNETKKYKFSYNLKYYFVGYDNEPIEIYYVGKILKNFKEVKLISNRLL